MIIGVEFYLVQLHLFRNFAINTNFMQRRTENQDEKWFDNTASAQSICYGKMLHLIFHVVYSFYWQLIDIYWVGWTLPHNVNIAVSSGEKIKDLQHFWTVLQLWATVVCQNSRGTKKLCQKCWIQVWNSLLQKIICFRDIFIFSIINDIWSSDPQLHHTVIILLQN